MNNLFGTGREGTEGTGPNKHQQHHNVKNQRYIVLPPNIPVPPRRSPLNCMTTIILRDLTNRENIDVDIHHVI